MGQIVYTQYYKDHDTKTLQNIYFLSSQLFLRISTPLPELIVRWLSDFSGLLKYLKPV